ncbi:MAG: hypothetical protein O2856_06065 [Planctomycetota bacterium]|nr:hypothetical protein [Planctomycetota bacterium]
MVGILVGMIILALVLISLGTGVAAFVTNSTAGATACEVISRATFVTVILTFALFVVPRCFEIFIGFGVELPALTILIFNLTVWNVWQSILFTLLMMFCVAADGVLFGVFHQQRSSRRLTQWISFAITICLTIIPFTIILGLYVPMVKLMNDLS